MTDVMLVLNGAAHEIWRDSAIESLHRKYHPDLIAQMVEVPAGTVNEHDLWDGAKLSPAPSNS